MTPTQGPTVDFHGRVAGGHHKLAITVTALAAVSIVVAGLAGAPAARHEPTAVSATHTTAVREADLFEPGLIAESRAMTASRSDRTMTMSRQFEDRLLVEAEQLASEIAPSHVTVDDVLEQRLITESGTGQ